MTKFRIVEILCVVFCVIFVISSVSSEHLTEKSSEEIISVLLPEMNDSELVSRKSAFLREKLNIDPSVFVDFCYYSSDDVMNVNELFVAVTDGEVSDDILTSFEEYVNEKYVLYNGYAPEQASYLNDYVLDVRSGALIFCVGKNAEGILSLFSETV